MPYARNAELPPGVRNALPAAAQTIYRNVYNSQAKRGMSEERCHASAWAAVQRAGWHKNPDGKWMKKKAAPEQEQETQKSFEAVVKITKLDEDQRLVFGWLSVIEENGQPVVDLQDHVIEARELEEAAYDFLLNSRVVAEMHERMNVGEGMIESMVFTKEKQESLGIDLGKVGWWVGFKVDADVFAKVKSGELSAFSIGGKAVLEDMLEAA